jgi:hypothetical protein
MTPNFVGSERPRAYDSYLRQQVGGCGSLRKGAVWKLLRRSRVPGGGAKDMLADRLRYPA